MKNECLEAVEQELDRVGVQYLTEYTRKHIHVVWGNERNLFVVPSTASDVRAVANARADIRRELRAKGYIEDNQDADTTRPIVVVRDGGVLCLSLDIAKHFSRAHKDVLRAIDKVRGECGAEFDRRNFAPIEYLDEKGRTYRAYELTQDGFSLVVMGFTGEAATRWKVKYINAFNAMSAELRKISAAEEVARLRNDMEALFDLVANKPSATIEPAKRIPNLTTYRSMVARRRARKAA